MYQINTANRENPVWVGIVAWAASVCFNTVEAEKLGLPAPKSWEDLTDPAYKGHINMPSPLSSGGIPCRERLDHYLWRGGWLEVHRRPA